MVGGFDLTWHILCTNLIHMIVLSTKLSNKGKIRITGSTCQSYSIFSVLPSSKLILGRSSLTGHAYTLMEPMDRSSSLTPPCHLLVHTTPLTSTAAPLHPHRRLLLHTLPLHSLSLLSCVQSVCQIFFKYTDTHLKY